MAATTEKDRQGDTFAPNAWAQSIAAWQARKSFPPLLRDHDRSRPVGALTAMKETPAGLEIEARLAMATDDGREAFDLAKSGALAFSVGALIQDSDDTDDGRLLKSADLLEVSLVTVPAQAGATIHTVKHFDSRKHFESALRDQLGLSRTQAKRLAAGGFRAMTQTEDELDDEIASAIQKHLANVARLQEVALPIIERRRNAALEAMQRWTFTPLS